MVAESFLPYWSPVVICHVYIAQLGSNALYSTRHEDVIGSMDFLPDELQRTFSRLSLTLVLWDSFHSGAGEITLQIFMIKAGTFLSDIETWKTSLS